MKVANIATVVKQMFPGFNVRRIGPELRSKMFDKAIKECHKRGLNVADDGRLYPTFTPSPERGRRWEKGRLIPRHS